MYQFEIFCKLLEELGTLFFVIILLRLVYYAKEWFEEMNQF